MTAAGDAEEADACCLVCLSTAETVRAVTWDSSSGRLTRRLEASPWVEEKRRVRGQAIVEKVRDVERVEWRGRGESVTRGGRDEE